jgi:hypothetical protein
MADLYHTVADFDLVLETFVTEKIGGEFCKLDGRFVAEGEK